MTKIEEGRMVKREFRANIIGDFKTWWINEAAKDEGMTIDKTVAAYYGPELENLHNRISGKVVTIVEHEYPEGENDFFEKEDNNFVMYRKLFCEIND
jgi:hypothetical protein